MKKKASALRYPPESAGSRMTRNVPTSTPDATIDQVKAMLSREGKNVDAMQYVYVLDDSGKLTGMLSMHELFRAKGSTRVGEACTRSHLLWVHPLKHQERAVYKALKHGIKAVPVVDPDRTFLGAIPSDTLLKILYKETHEDLLRRAGFERGHPLFDNVLTLPLWVSLLHRLPWLLIGLLGGLLTAEVVGFFEHTLQQNLVLAAFIPLIVYMSSAAGMQTEALLIRDLAIDRHIPFGKYFVRQSFIVLGIAAACAGTLYGASRFLKYSHDISTVLGIALFAAIVSSVFTGLLVPFLFSRFRADPANASGPIATIIQDLLSLVIYFGVASAMLG